MAPSGQCNICGEIAPLTEDHVPPKGCTKVSPVFIQDLEQKLRGTRGKYSGNGLKFKTICAACNNSLLGGKYDRSLTDFCKTAILFLEANKNLCLPPIMTIPVQPVRLIKAIAGHILSSADTTRHDLPLDSDYWSILRHIVCNEEEDIPANLELFYWPYPYERQVAVQFFTYMSVKNSSHVLQGGVAHDNYISTSATIRN